MSDLRIRHEQMLKEAARDGDLSKVIIAMDVHRVSPTVSNDAPLRFTISGMRNDDKDTRTRCSIAKELLKRGANPRTNNGMPVNSAIISGNQSLLEILIAHDSTLLQDDAAKKAVSNSMAPKKVQLEILATFIKHGVHPNALLEANKKLKPFIVDYLIQQGGDLTVAEGRHANDYFAYLNLSPYALFDKFDKHLHPLIVRFMSYSL